MNEYDQADFVEGKITVEERQQAKTLEAILRYDIIREAKESQTETIQKIKDLINKKTATINTLPFLRIMGATWITVNLNDIK